MIASRAPTAERCESNRNSKHRISFLETHSTRGHPFFIDHSLSAILGATLLNGYTVRVPKIYILSSISRFYIAVTPPTRRKPVHSVVVFEGLTAGNRIEKRVSIPGVLVTLTLPPCPSMICRTRLRPIPDPRCFRVSVVETR